MGINDRLFKWHSPYVETLFWRQHNLSPFLLVVMMIIMTYYHIQYCGDQIIEMILLSPTILSLLLLSLCFIPPITTERAFFPQRLPLPVTCTSAGNCIESKVYSCCSSSGIYSCKWVLKCLTVGLKPCCTLSFRPTAPNHITWEETRRDSKEDAGWDNRFFLS